MGGTSSGAILLGGAASPIGWWVTFIEAPMLEIEAWLTVHWFEGRSSVAADSSLYPSCIPELEPLESPWTKHLLVSMGNWTVHLSNSIGGGDPSAPGPVLSRDLNCQVVIAGHSPRHGPGHEGTALWVLGPAGTPPLYYVRTVQVHCADGRWTWHESGPPLDFERVERYSRRRKRDRLFDRKLLMDYLESFGLFPDDPKTYGRARLVSGDSTTGRSVSVEHRRQELGLK